MPRLLSGRPAPPARVIKAKRISPRQRGYDGRWDRASRDYRRRHPFCAWCEQCDQLRFADVVDHKIPITDGGAMFAPTNWWGLCHLHHGVKASMEAFARQTEQIDRLPLWCDDPQSRPRRFGQPQFQSPAETPKGIGGSD